jgi:FixJ family two-component response regulator
MTLLSEFIIIRVENNLKFMPFEDKMFYRRQKVMKHFVSGMTQLDIAYDIGISLATVERDIKYIRENLIVPQRD